MDETYMNGLELGQCWKSFHFRSVFSGDDNHSILFSFFIRRSTAAATVAESIFTLHTLMTAAAAVASNTIETLAKNGYDCYRLCCTDSDYLSIDLLSNEIVNGRVSVMHVRESLNAIINEIPHNLVRPRWRYMPEFGNVRNKIRETENVFMRPKFIFNVPCKLKVDYSVWRRCYKSDRTQKGVPFKTTEKKKKMYLVMASPCSDQKRKKHGKWKPIPF